MKKTIDLQQENIKDEFQDCVELASEIIGIKCFDTVMQGDREKDKSESTKYQILPDPYSVELDSIKIDLLGFTDYFHRNFGKWKDRAYFDTPAQAFVALIKAWDIWNNHLENRIKSKYKEPSERMFKE